MSKQFLLGIDIGTFSMKLVELEKGKDKFFLRALREIPLPPGLFGAFIKSGSEDCLSVTSSYLKKLLANSGLHSKDAVSAITSENTFVTTVILPPLPDNEIDYAMDWQIKKQVSDYPKEKTASWKVVSRSPEGIEVLIVAVSKFLASRYIQVIKDGGLNPYSLQIEPLALAKSLMKPSDDATIIVHLGVSSSNINLVENGNLKLTRNLKISENEMIKSLSGLVKDHSEAKKLLYEVGFLRSKRVGKVYNSLKPLFSTLAIEIKRLSGYFQEKSGKEISRIILSGGLAAIPNIVGYISEDSGMQVVSANPWINVDYSLMPNQDRLISLGPRFAVAVGLAME